MIIQGTNNPIIFTFATSMDAIRDIEISLYNDEIEMKHWTLNEVEISDTKVIAPLKQTESVKFPCGKCSIEIKWIDESGKTNFAKELKETVIKRRDHTIMEETSA